MDWQRAKASLLHSLLVSVIGLTSTASATIHYVSKTGTSTPPYTSWQSAAWFVESANEVTLPGDTIRIASGDYNVGAPMYLKDRVAVIGQGQDSTRLYGFEGLASFFVVPHDSSTIKGIAFHGNSADNAIWAVETLPFPKNTVLTVEDCYFTRCKYEYVFFVQGRELTVRNCHFSGFSYGAIQVDGFGGGYATGTYTIENCVFFSLSFPLAVIEFREVAGDRIIRNCEFYPTAYISIEDDNCFGSMHVENCAFMSAGAGYKSIWCNADSLNLINNSFYRFDRFTDGLEDFVAIYQPYLKYANITNNVFQTHMDNAAHTLAAFIGFFGTAAPIYPKTMIKIRNNCIWANRPFGLDKLYSTKSGFIEIDSLSDNIIADPMFVAPPPEIPLNKYVAVDNDFASLELLYDEDHDLHLQYGSPCIDAGLATLVDVDGSRSDIGAYGGSSGVSYSYPDLPPRTTSKFEGMTTANSVVLRWLTNTESDLSQYALYRGTSAGFPPDDDHRIASITDVPDSLLGNPETDSLYYTYEDTAVTLHTNYYYALIAVDGQNNASEASPELAFIVTDAEDQIDMPLPQQFELLQNYPNPFNATTAIVYNLPNIGAQPASVQLFIYNSLGQRVKTLIDQRQNSGRQVAYWDGTDDNGQSMASGIYFYSLNVSGVEFAKKRKMVLMK